jgi:hypothetical protein
MIEQERKNMYKTIYTEVEVDVDLGDFDTEDLVEELESRGAGGNDFGDGKDILTRIYEKRRLGQDYQDDLDELIYLGLGKII